jgi:predicted DNA binding CopG/RHH family protein
MLFAIGTKVRFRYTGETGTITAMLDDGMLQVRLDSDRDFEIPAFEEDLLRNTDAEPVSPGAKFINKPEKAIPIPPRTEIKRQYVILKSKGIQLGFEPMPGRDGNVSKYKAWLINDTKFDFMVDFELWVLDKKVLFLNERLASMTAIDAGNIMFDDLNDGPEVDVFYQRFTTAGLEDGQERIVKIRAKQFFNTVITAPILDFQVHHYVLFDNFENNAEENAPKDDLKSYTNQKVKDLEREKRSTPNYKPYDSYNIEEFANFEPEIDLHIQNLTNGYAKMDKSMMVRIQMEHFERFMEKAFRLGVPRVYIIHGVGEGKLKDAIGDRLSRYNEVKKFKNEYHPKYGYGATEVVFK